MVQERTLPVVSAPVQITKEEGLRLYEVVLGRFFEEMRGNVLQGQNVWVCPPVQRSGSRLLVSFRRCDREDYVSSTYRDHVHALVLECLQRVMRSYLQSDWLCKGRARFYAHVLWRTSLVGRLCLCG